MFTRHNSVWLLFLLWVIFCLTKHKGSVSKHNRGLWGYLVVCAAGSRIPAESFSSVLSPAQMLSNHIMSQPNLLYWVLQIRWQTVWLSYRSKVNSWEAGEFKLVGSTGCLLWIIHLSPCGFPLGDDSTAVLIMGRLCLITLQLLQKEREH